MTTIDASRLIAERTGHYNGQAPEQYIYLDAEGSPSIVSEIPLPQLPLKPGQSALPREPWAVRTTVYRKDFSQPVSSIARFDAYAATYAKDGEIKLNEMWARRGPEQLAKCSEMLSLRKAFPEELGGLYIAEEFKPDQDEVAKQPVSPAVAIPSLPAVPKVDQTPATGTDAPRPGEKVEFHTDKVPATLPEHSGSTLIVKDAVIAAVPGLKPASELPPPKKRGRKPKESPNNGQLGAGEITDEDTAQIGTPAPVIDHESEKKAAEEFVASTDPTPTKEEMAGFTARVRALSAAGALSTDLKNYVLSVGKKSEPKELTVANWTEALGQLEAALAESKDKLKEVTKNAPLPAF